MKQEEDRERIPVPVRRHEAPEEEKAPEKPVEVKVWRVPDRWRVC